MGNSSIEKNNVEKRNYFIDNCKAIVIFNVIICHLAEFSHGNYIQELIYIEYSFNMPILIFISGYLAKYKPEKLIKNTLVPFVIIQMLFFIFYNYVISVPTAFYLVYAYPTLWYMISLFCWYLLIPILDSVKKPIITIIILVILGLVIGYDANANSIFSISRTITFLPVFALGYYAKKYDWKLTKKTTLTKIISFILVALVVVGIYQHGNFQLQVIFTGSKPYSPTSGTILLRLLYYVIIYIWIIFFINFVSTKKTIYSYIGKNTLSIYLGHYFLCHILRVTGVLYIGSHPMLNCIIYAIIILLILSPNFLNKYFKKIFCLDFKRKE